MSVQLVAVVARSRNNVIGYDNALPWRLSSDLKRFKALTMGKPMIMGRQTWDSIGKPLPGRQSVVVTRNPAFRAEGAHVATSPMQAVAIARRLAAEMGANEIIVAGGEEIFRALMDETDFIQLTEIDMETSGDAFFPVFDPAQWREIARSKPERGPKDDADFAYVTLARKTVAGGAG